MHVDQALRTVQIRVLGPVELVVDGRRVALSPLECGLLAMLVAYGGRMISADRLLDALWAPRPPASGRNRVQAVVSSLRRAVGTADLVVTTGGGYQLRSDAGVLDAARFAGLVRDARAHAAANRIAEAAQSYRAALDLWRGEAFDHAVAARDPLIRAESARMNESRLAATEELMDMKLALGHHREISADLGALVAAYPYRENLRRQLMLGLVRSGQATEALLAYRQGYALLRDELGTEPGPELQSLHREILAGGPSSGPPDPAPEPLVATRSWPLPDQLPMTIRDFVGRIRELDAIARALRRPASAASPAVIGITGLGGVGKTTLAVRAATQARADFPDGVLYAELRGMSVAPVDPRSALGAFLRALGLHPEAVPNDADERLGLFRSLTAGRRLLVVLDDAADEAQVRSLLPAGGGCAAIVTARTDLTGLDGADVIALDGLTVADGARLLDAIAGAGRVAATASDGERVVQICGGHPLALRIIGVRLAARPGLTLARLAERLVDESLRLGELAAGDRSVRGTFALSYRRLDRRPAALLCQFGVHPGPDLSLAAVAALGAMSGSEARELINELCSVHLITETATADDAGDERYRVHDLIHAFAAEKAAEEDPAGADAALRRLLGWYIDGTVTGRTMLTGREWPPAAPARHPLQPARFASHPEVITWFVREHANAHALLQEADRRGWHDLTWRLAYGLHSLHLTSHTVDGWVAAVERGVAAAVAVGDGAAEIRTRSDLGSAYYMLGRLVDAENEWQQALRRCGDLGEHAESARCHDNLGLLYHQRGELALAADHHLRALAVPTYVADPSSAAAVHLHVAIVRADQGRYDESEAGFDSALRHAATAGNRFLECHIHHNAAELQRIRGGHHRAREHAEAEIHIARAAKLPLREARGLELLGDCDRETDAARARRSWLAAIDIYDRIKHPAGAALRARHGIGTHDPQ